MTPDEVSQGLEKLHAAYQFLTQISARYPINFAEDQPYGAADKTVQALKQLGKVLTGDDELFQSHRLNPNPAIFNKESSG